MKRSVIQIIAIVCILSMLLSGCGLFGRKPEKPVASDVTASTSDVITVASLKASYGYDDSKTEIKPFYNVEQTTQFTFHFNSEVEPCFAVTVHTDPKCGML